MHFDLNLAFCTLWQNLTSAIKFDPSPTTSYIGNTPPAPNAQELQRNQEWAAVHRFGAEILFASDGESYGVADELARAVAVFGGHPACTGNMPRQRHISCHISRTPMVSRILKQQEFSHGIMQPQELTLQRRGIATARWMEAASAKHLR